MGRTRASTQAATAQLSKSITHLQSLNVVRNMIRVSVSEICYLRSTLYSNCFDVDAVGLTIHALQDLFPPDLFKERVYADMQIKCLAPTKDLSTPDTENAWLVTQWLEEGVFEALNKKYLEALMLGVYALRPGNEPGKLLESYTYNIQHGESGGTQLTTSFAGEIPIKYTAENVKDQAIQLIRSLVSITTNLDPLPPNRLITMKLTFNNQCPADWKPKYFEGSCHKYASSLIHPSLKIEIGRVITPHHIVAMELETIEEHLEKISCHGSQPALSEKNADDTGSDSGNETDVTRLSHNTNVSQLVGSQLEATDGSDTESEDLAKKQPIVRKRTPTKEELLEFIVESKTQNARKLKVRFPAMRSEDIIQALENFCDEGVLRPGQSAHTYEVTAHDSNMFNGAVYHTHGKLKRSVNAQNLAAAMKISPLVARTLLHRMEKEKLLEKRENCPFLGYKVIFTEGNRAIIRSAVHHAKHSVSTARETTMATQENSPIPKKQPNSTSANLPTRRSDQPCPTVSQRCAAVPIVQTNKALKRRRLALHRSSQSST